MRYRILSLLCVVVVGCGSEFATAPAHPDGSGGSGSASTSAITDATGGEASTANVTSSGGSDAVTSDAPCGELRSDTAANDVELCVPAGTFVMGSQSANLGTGHADHTPPHPVTLSAYAIDAFEVTVGRYRACATAGACEAPATDSAKGCTYGGTNDNLPVSCVTASQAERFCSWDGNRRLPTEAEWERAARGTDERSFPWGAPFACDRANAAANAACAGVHGAIAVVGSLPAGDSPIGAHDMAGNVAEWVQDFASSYPATAVANPTGPTTGVSRILRGGAVSNNSPDVQTFIRLTTSGSTIGSFGFRCARSAAR